MQELRNRNIKIERQRRKYKNVLTFLFYHSRFYIPVFLFLALFLLSCASLKQASFPREWKQTAQPASMDSAPVEKNNFLKITALDIGQGDSVLIQTPNGKAILIDAGTKGKGVKVIIPYLQAHQIKTLAAIIASHYDGDHIGGISEVIAGADGKLNTEDDFFPEFGVFDRGGTPLDSAPLYSEYLKAVGKDRITLESGVKIEIDPEVSIRSVAVNGEVWNGEHFDLFQPGVYETENSTSVSLLIEYKNFRYLTSGDLTGGGSPGGFKTIDVETSLAKQIGQVTVVHVNHHGSASSSNETFTQTLKPKIALFNVGNGNDYHHPNQEVLEGWKRVGAELWLTEKGSGGFISGEKVVNGPIEMITDGNSLNINGEKVE